MFSNVLLELYWIKSLDRKSLFIARGNFSDRHEYLVILFKMFFVLMTRPKLCNTGEDNNTTLFIIISILLRLGHPLFFLRLLSSDRPKFLAFSKKKK